MTQMYNVDLSFDNVDKSNNHSTLMIVMVYIDIRHITSYPVVSICYMLLHASEHNNVHCMHYDMMTCI